MMADFHLHEMYTCLHFKYEYFCIHYIYMKYETFYATYGSG